MNSRIAAGRGPGQGQGRDWICSFAIRQKRKERAQASVNSRIYKFTLSWIRQFGNFGTCEFPNRRIYESRRDRAAARSRARAKAGCSFAMKKKKERPGTRPGPSPWLWLWPWPCPFISVYLQSCKSTRGPGSGSGSGSGPLVLVVLLGSRELVDSWIREFKNTARGGQNCAPRAREKWLDKHPDAGPNDTRHLATPK